MVNTTTRTISIKQVGVLCSAGVDRSSFIDSGLCLRVPAISEMQKDLQTTCAKRKQVKRNFDYLYYNDPNTAAIKMIPPKYVSNPALLPSKGDDRSAVRC